MSSTLYSSYSLLQVLMSSWNNKFCVIGMKNQAIIEAIRELLPTYQKLRMNSAYKGDANTLKYLIGQIVRQYDVPASNWHVSKAAEDRWCELTANPNIRDYHYKDLVKCDKLAESKTYNVYKGASKAGVKRKLNSGSAIQFREMFHEDHVIPVSLMLDELAKMNSISAAGIKALLDKMHLCVILKEEDRVIGRTKGRSLDFQKTVNGVYVPAGIILV